MIKRIIVFSFISLLLILVSSGFAAKTLVGYVNGEKLLMGVTYNNKWGSLMLTTTNGSVDWDNLSESLHSYSEDWQTHSAGFPADWRMGAGSSSIYNVVTGSDNILQASALSNSGRILHGATASDTTWQTPVDFSVTAKNIQLQYESNTTNPALWSIFRIGFAGEGGTNDFSAPIQISASGLYAYQFFCSTLMLDPTEQVYGVPQCVSIRDGQAIPLHAISYSGFTSGATLTFRLVVREPIPVEFVDANKDSVSSISSSGAYIKVEALDPFSFNSAARDTTQVTLWTSIGDNETINLPELFDVQTTVGSLYNCNNNVFWNETPIPISSAFNIIPATIRLMPGQTTTFQAAAASASPNGTIDGFGVTTAYVAYGSSTASATVVCGGATPFTWHSSDTTIGSINSTTGVFTAITTGTVTVTASDANGFSSSTATVQILTTDAPMAIETPSLYLHRSELFDIAF
jgi:hypothetical protein